MSSDTFVAVVVTYNRLSLLKEAIDGLRAQTYPLSAIIVINNSSTDGTLEWLTEQKDITTITQENKGGAFGFYTGIKAGYENGYEWIWCMDDDGRPAPTAAENLMRFTDRKPCVMNSLVLDKDNPDRILFSPLNLNFISEIKTPTLENVGTFFNATLFHRDVVQKVGFPLKDLIIWGDETEYAYRISNKFEFPLFTVVDSCHYHPAQYSKFYKKEWELQQGWKVYFFIRNKKFVYESKFNNRLKANAAYLFFLSAFFGLIILKQKTQKRSKLSLLFTAAKNGFAKKTDISLRDVQQYINRLAGNSHSSK